MEIYCPKCEWEPPPSAEWACTCGHSWHTFDTHGKCPKCGTVWRETQCFACQEWSPHHDWYHALPPVDVDEITEETGVPADHEAAFRSGEQPGPAGSVPVRRPAASTPLKR